jgi:hypothetical protein
MDVARVNNTGLAPVSSPIPKPRPQQQGVSTPVSQNLGNSNASNRNSVNQRATHASDPNRLSFSPAAKTQATAQVTSSTSNARATQIINSLKPHVSNPAKFAQELNKFLQNPQDRASLINHYGLDSKESKDQLGIAMFLEAGQGLDSKNMKPVGAAILNRVIGNNVALEASGSTRRVSISSVMGEKGQFESLGKFKSALKTGKGAASTYGKGEAVQAMVSDLVKGNVGSNQNAETAFYFRRGKMSNETMRTPDGHSFATKYDSGLNYIGNSPLVRHTGSKFK